MMNRALCLLTLTIGVLLPVSLLAHDVRPAYLEIRETEPATYDVLWKVPTAGRNAPPDLEVQFPHGTQQLGTPQEAVVDGAYLEKRRIHLEGGLAGRTIHIAGLAGAPIDVLARVDTGRGVIQTSRITPDAPDLEVETSPTGWEVSRTYLELGIEHILLGIDHLLFVLALVVLVKGKRRLVGTITAFTLAHSITLAAATLGFVHVPGPPVEACIALSIVFVASEIVHGRQGRPGLTARAPWVVAFTFGLLHGFGFAGALSEVGLPPQAIPLALLFFNVGVELGQLGFIGMVYAVIALGRRLLMRAPGWGWRIVPYAVGSVAMFWVIQRTLAF